MLTEEQTRKLARLRGCYTRYEVEVALPDKRKMLVCYTPRKNLAGLREVIRERWEPLVRAVGIPGSPIQDTPVMRDGRAYKFENGSIVRFSGRTQRDAIILGELPFIGPPAS
jgi:hypothetical protein